MKKEYFKVVYFVMVFCYFLEGKIMEGFSDDGEFKGSLGMFMFSVLR